MQRNHKIHIASGLKSFNKLGIDGTYLKIIKDVYEEKVTTKIMLNWGKLKAFPFISGTKQKCALFILLFQYSIGSIGKIN